MTTDRKDAYLLNRSNLASIRLTTQHFLWHEHLGWNLHPDVLASIKDPEQTTNTRSLAVADVACGNGIWLIQESQSLAYPPGTTFYGFDISDELFPSAAIIPSNVKFSKLNASHPSHIPEQYHNAFDVVHARLLMGAIFSPTPVSFLQAFLTLLKPGGFLQWDEVSPHDPQPVPQSLAPSKWAGWPVRLIKRCRPQADMPITWMNTLPSLFEEQSMIDVKGIRGGPPKHQMRSYWTDNEFGVMTEIATSLGADKEAFEELEEGWRNREQEIAFEIRIALGRKRLS